MTILGLKSKALIACLAAILTACGGGTYATSAPEPAPLFYHTTRYHDDEYRVTCWVFSNGYQGGISCIPDAQLGDVPHGR